MAHTRFAIGMQRMSFQQHDILLLEPSQWWTKPHQPVYHNLRVQETSKESSRLTFTTLIIMLTGPIVGAVPWLGYHHVLMLLNAVAIILLCKSSSHIPVTLLA